MKENKSEIKVVWRENMSKKEMIKRDIKDRDGKRRIDKERDAKMRSLNQARWMKKRWTRTELRQSLVELIEISRWRKKGKIKRWQWNRVGSRKEMN